MSNKEKHTGYSSYKGATREYKNNPTIEHYVELRRKQPDEIIEVSISSGIDWLFSNESTLDKFDIPAILVVSTLDANQKAISELCLRLLELLIDRKEAQKLGGTHLASRGEAISDSLVNHLISMMMDGLDWTGSLEMNRDLIVLIRNQIGSGTSSALEQAQRVHDLRTEAVHLGAQLLELEGGTSKRAVARVLELNPSTISRLFPENTFEHEIAELLEFWKGFYKSETPFADLIKKHQNKPPPE